MSGVNKVILIGNLGKDPEVRHTQDGKAIVTLSLATSETWRDKSSGERKEKTEWHKIVIFNEGIAKVAEQYLKKGSTIYIEGSLQTRKWTDKDGLEKYSTEIVLQNYGGALTMLGGKQDDAGNDERPARKSVSALESQRPSATSGRLVDLDDEVPFMAEFR